MVLEVPSESQGLCFFECWFSNSKCHGTALLCHLRRLPSKDCVVAGVPEKKEVHLVCFAKFCLWCTQSEISLTNFSIHGKDWIDQPRNQAACYAVYWFFGHKRGRSPVPHQPGEILPYPLLINLFPSPAKQVNFKYRSKVVGWWPGKFLLLCYAVNGPSV